MTIRAGDNLKSTRQADGRFSVVVVIAHPDGDRRFVAIVDDADAFYDHVRYMVDNPEPIDYEAERAVLVKQREAIEQDIVQVDTRIADRDADIKEVPK